MNKPKFVNILSLSTQKIIEEISSTELEIFNLRFKKATRQTFKPHELKFLKKKLAQLKTLLIIKVNEIKDKEDNFIS